MIYNKLVLKLRAGDNVVSVIKLNPSYNLMVDLEKIPLGWGWKDVIRNPNKYIAAFQSVNVETIVAILEPYRYLIRV